MIYCIGEEVFVISEFHALSFGIELNVSYFIEKIHHFDIGVISYDLTNKHGKLINVPPISEKHLISLKELRLNKIKKIYMLNNGCEAGCKAYTGGEIRHHKDCQYYPESFTKMYDDLKAENASLKNQVDNLKTEIIISKNKKY